MTSGTVSSRSHSIAWIFPAVIVAVGAGAYHNSLAGPFIFDDIHAIVEDPNIRQPFQRWQAILETVRPVVTWTLAANYWWGMLEVRGYHVVNLAIHIAAALVLYGLVRRTLLLEHCAAALPQYSSNRERSEPRKPGQARSAASASCLALAVSLLWVVHSIQTESVTYVIQRAESLMGLFYLLTLYCILRGHQSDRPARWNTLAVVSCALGMGTKEVMVTAPILTLLYDRVFLAGSWHEIVRRRWRLYVALAATWVILIVPLRMAFGPDVSNGVVGGAGFQLPGLTPFQYALSQPRVIAHYLRLSLWPHPLCLDYNWPIAEQAIDIIPAALLLILLLSPIAWAWLRFPALAFLGTAFFVILAPTSSIAPIRDLAFEHRMYLSLAAEVILAVLAGYFVLHWLEARAWLSAGAVRFIGTLAVGLPVLGLALATIARNEQYQSAVAIWADVVEQCPKNSRAHNNLGEALKEEGRLDKAIDEYRIAIRLDERNAEAHDNLGVALREQGRWEEAIRCYLSALQANPQFALAYNNLALARAHQGKMDSAADLLARAVEIKPDLALAQDNLGEVLERLGKKSEAMVCFRRAVAAAPESVKYHCDLASALWDDGQFEASRTEYRRAFELFPNWPEAANGAARSLATTTDPARKDGYLAARYAKQACQASGERRPEFFDTLALAYAALGDFDQAADAARKGLAVTNNRETAQQLRIRLAEYENRRHADQGRIKTP
jgi:Flp pilus assembly protein TadD